MWCHLLFAMPFVGLLLFWVLPWPVALPTYLVLVGLTALILIPTFRTMRGRVTTGAEGMIGCGGVVVREIRSEGTVRVRGELWTARAREPIPAGEAVRVVALDGLCLRVEQVREGR